MADTMSSHRKTIGWYVMIGKLYEQTFPKGAIGHGIVEKFYNDLTQAERNLVRVDNLIWDYMSPSERIPLLLSHTPWDQSLDYFSEELEK